jgi:hypothetical protein
VKKLNPDDTRLNVYGCIISHLPSWSRPIEKKEIPIRQLPERFTIDRKDGLVTPVHNHLRISCSDVLETKKQISASTSTTSLLKQKLLQVTSVDSIAYQLYKLYWKDKRRMDREKEAAEDIRRSRLSNIGYYP